MPSGYSFRFVPAVGQIVLYHDSDVVICDRMLQRLACSSNQMHLTFQYGPIQTVFSRKTGAKVEVSADEPSCWGGKEFWPGVVGCIVVATPYSASQSGGIEVSILELEACELAQAPSRDEERVAPPVHLTRKLRDAPGGDAASRKDCAVQVPCQAPRRPKSCGLQVCLESVNVAAFAHLLEADAAAASRILPCGRKPLSFAVDKLVSKAWESSRCLSAFCAMILSLIECQADVNEKADHGETPLHALLRLQSDREVVQLCKVRLAVALLRAKADPNTSDTCGDSPLAEAASMGDSEMCKLLLEHGARAKLPWPGLDPEVHRLMEEAASRQQNLLSSLLFAGRSYLLQDLSRAASCFADALALDPLNPGVLLAAAEAEYATGNFSSAYQHASRGVATDPMNGLPYAMCAKALWQLDRVKEALAVMDLIPDAAKQGATDASATCGRILRHYKCLSAVEELLANGVNPDISTCSVALQDLESLLTDTTPEEQLSAWGIRVRLTTVKLCIVQSQPEQARQHWTARALSETKQLRKANGQCGQVLHWHARALLQAGLREDAISALRCASQLPGGDDGLLSSLLKAEALRSEGEAAAARGSWESALKYYEDAEVGGAFDPDFHSLLLAEKAMAKCMMKRGGEALHDVTAGLNISSNFARLYFVRGLIHMELEMYARAAADFERVSAIDREEMPVELLERARRWARLPPVEDHYAALGLSKTATSKDIKKAYRLAALRWHPDKNAGNESLAELVFKKVQAAFDVLSGEQSRKAYDDYPGDRKPFEHPSFAEAAPNVDTS